MQSADQSGSGSRLRSFILYVSVVLTLLMLLFPPYNSLNGTEYAFIMTGPAWMRGLEQIAEPLGLSVRVDWITLGGQLVALWAISLGALWFTRRDKPSSLPLAPALVLLLLPLSQLLI